jgi:hypothetical protein
MKNEVAKFYFHSVVRLKIIKKTARASVMIEEEELNP